MSVIRGGRARSVWDSRGRPTIEVEVDTDEGTGRGIAPAGASTGSFEAVELRDRDGLGVDDACGLFRRDVVPVLVGMDSADQASIDERLIALDGTRDRRRLGGNTLIATSMAVANADARSRGTPLYRLLAGDRTLFELPLPEIQIMGGGAHAHGRLDLQDLMVVPVGAADWPTALRWCADVYRSMGRLLTESGSLGGVADEGGFFPAVDGNEEAIGLVTRAIETSSHAAGEDIVISIDVAANQIAKEGRYRLSRDGESLDASAWLERLARWCRRYPIRMVEDPASEGDAASFRDFRRAVSHCVVVGDDLVVTNAERIRAAALGEAIDAALIKPNQAGTLTEAKAALDTCNAHDVIPIVSARSGETEDVTIVHLAVGWGAPMLKVGSITRGERTAKWNEMLRISEALGHPPLAKPLR